MSSDWQAPAAATPPPGPVNTNAPLRETSIEVGTTGAQTVDASKLLDSMGAADALAAHVELMAVPSASSAIARPDFARVGDLAGQGFDQMTQQMVDQIDAATITRGVSLGQATAEIVARIRGGFVDPTRNRGGTS